MRPSRRLLRPGPRLPAALLAVCLAVVQAETVDPFVASVPVADRGGAARAAALPGALAQSLAKLSGQPAISPPPGLAQARAALQQFRYLAAPEGDGQQPGLRLEARFAPEQVRAIAADRALPVWPLERGITAVWVAVGDGGSRHVLGERPEDGALLAALGAAAERRALPLALPLLDLQDQATVSVSEIWGGFADRLRAASARYQADHVLAGRLERTGAGWSGRWLLDLGGRSERWDGRGATPEEVLAGAVEEAASRVARVYAVLPGLVPATATRLTVFGVESPEHYARLLGYLESLSIVDAVLPRRLSGRQVEFELTLSGDDRALQQVLALDEVLVAAGPAAMIEGLAYRLARMPVSR